MLRQPPAPFPAGIYPKPGRKGLGVEVLVAAGIDLVGSRPGLGPNTRIEDETELRPREGIGGVADLIARRRTGAEQ
ncbi:hypothetical protein [Nocardia fusca]|uniref:hypothetical protein n=1 Tax=Nocardia fusca TaxID=941183 RepID=UPI0007A73581|nr:hypothetical protein [Nocardia fusca]